MFLFIAFLILITISVLNLCCDYFLQEGLEPPASSSNRISRPASQNAIISNSNYNSSFLCNEKETSSVPHSFTPVVGPSQSRKAPGPGLPPVSSIVRPADMASSFSSLSLSKPRLPDGDNYSQSNYLVDAMNNQRLSFQHRFPDHSRKDNLGPVNFHRRAVSSADLNSTRNMFEFSNLEGSNVRNQVDNFPGIDLSSRVPSNNHFPSGK